jgi:hypothetical protein
LHKEKHLRQQGRDNNGAVKMARRAVQNGKGRGKNGAWKTAHHIRCDDNGAARGEKGKACDANGKARAVCCDFCLRMFFALCVAICAFGFHVLCVAWLQCDGLQCDALFFIVAETKKSSSKEKKAAGSKQQSRACILITANAKYK